MIVRKGKYMSNKCSIWLVYGILMILAIYGFLGKQISVWDACGMPYSAADCLTVVCQPYVLGMFYIPLTVGLIIKNEDSRLKKVFIVQFVHRKNIWKWQFKRVMLSSFYCSTYVTIVSLAIGALSSSEWINWGSRYSIFFVEVEQLYQGTFIFIAILFLFFTWFKTVLLSMIFLCTEWFGGRRIYTWLSVICLAIVEWCISNSKIFFRLFSVVRTNFKYRYEMPGIVILSILLIILVYKVGKKGVERKEFYDE